MKVRIEIDLSRTEGRNLLTADVAETLTTEIEALRGIEVEGSFYEINEATVIQG